MRFYRLSEQKVRSIIHAHNRVEEGIAPKTVAFMKRAGTPKNPYELWVMVQDEPARRGGMNKRKVISAWRYPGTTKPGDPLPPEILKEIRRFV